MNTFEEAQAEALKARQAIDKLEGMKAEKTKELGAKREEFASYELGAIDSLQKLEGEISEARRELQAALQRQNDAPIGTGFVPALEAKAEEKPAEEAATAQDQPAASNLGAGFRVNPFNGARQAFSGDGYGDGNT